MVSFPWYSISMVPWKTDHGNEVFSFINPWLPFPWCFSTFMVEVALTEQPDEEKSNSFMVFEKFNILDDIMKDSMKNIGKGEAAPVKQEPVAEESQEEESTNPQFGFKLEPVKAEEEFVVAPEKEKEEVPKKKQVILDKPSQSMDDDIIVEW